MKLKDLLAITCLMVLLYALLNFIGIGCPIKYTTGISCAGCGMTRSWKHLLSFDIVTAFYYHPLFWIPPIFVLCLLYKNRLPSKVFKTVVTISILLFITVYLIRLINPEDTVVIIDIKNGAFYRIYKVLREKKY